MRVCAVVRRGLASSSYADFAAISNANCSPCPDRTCGPAQLGGSSHVSALACDPTIRVP